ncbi:Ion transport protein [Deinococcus proteolyticus MRP]|uniref:Ion transport protein n=1 Tax=Deinococcus proteolyticus (strain ATCC 35074 / DSM 20540 / JCM 6276 / NBRC 101906 / NCIMB 13154 / VKM Ac-1939 / CCM 2703 / MRP) TaxID=693977 RepID=F0RJG7_DEIPM|nr:MULTISPECIES: ion transporter [Deinococcus]ADY25508.1 Ion transport protein [Deinococcus proteolyticus MRP]MCY1701628.1 ion transporter [Deinococcus sp. SL84]
MPAPSSPTPQLDRRPKWRRELGNVIFGMGSPLARLYDKIVIFMIIASVLAVMAESVTSLGPEWKMLLRWAEWGFTVIFTLDYIGRLVGARRPLHYARSFYGAVDLLTILPSYLSLFFPGSQYLLVIRALRLLRVFRVFKLARYTDQASLLGEALTASRERITVFFISVLTLVIVFGTLLYMIEGPQNGFTSIPTSIYWAVVTVTTVGYGDISPKTGLGKFLATLAMLLGYAIIAVPTGIVTVGLTEASAARKGRHCPQCGLSKHEADAHYCKRCGENLPNS